MLIRRHKYLLAAATAAAISLFGAVTAPAQTPRQPCARTYTVHTYRLTITRIYHYRRPVRPHELAHLRTMRQCPANPARRSEFRAITRRQARARRHRKTLVAQGCGSPACNRRLGRRMVISRYGLSGWNCTYPIIDQESHWDATVHNGGGHGYVPGKAYGIPQALPGSKMASAGRGWIASPRVQIRWLLTYLRATYGGPCGALAHKRATGWY